MKIILNLFTWIPDPNEIFILCIGYIYKWETNKSATLDSSSPKSLRAATGDNRYHDMNE